MARALRQTIGTILLAMSGGAALAGPPYETDDPEPTDAGHWEIYAFAAGSHANGAIDGAAGLDLNYGAAPGVQLTATLPIDFARDRGGPTHSGAGDLELGVKYRFLHDGAAGVSIAIFPRIILPTARQGFGTARVRGLLPLWAQKDFGPWSLFGGAGYTINPGAGNRDFWQAGVALTRTVTPRLVLGAEITRETADAVGGRATTAFGLGLNYRLGGPFALLVSAGPAFEHHDDGAQFHIYAALAVNF
jgi:Putative MetA-pathway of phenol degradation